LIPVSPSEEEEEQFRARGEEHLRAPSIVLDPTKKTELIIGRQEGCDVRLEFGALSRRHASLSFDSQNGCWTLKDLKSHNGVAVNRVRVSLRKLREDDIVAFGGVQHLTVGDHADSLKTHLLYKFVSESSPAYNRIKRTARNRSQSSSINSDAPTIDLTAISTNDTNDNHTNDTKNSDNNNNDVVIVPENKNQGSNKNINKNEKNKISSKNENKKKIFKIMNNLMERESQKIHR